MKNKVMLITYADSLGKNLNELRDVLDNELKEVVAGIHILPFYPSSGDRGFAPIDYREVDKQFGSWKEIETIAASHDLMVDFMVNHISKQSSFFRDFLEKKEDSQYKDLFIRYSKFWPNGYPSPKDVDLIYKRKPRAPYVDVIFSDQSTDKVWCTFDEEQIDLDVTTEVTKKFIKETLEFLAMKGAKSIRLDAFAYANKKIGTNCFFVEPEIWELLDYCQKILIERDVEVLPEIHEHYSIQHKIAEHDYYVYDFALPMLVLHALYSGKNERLLHWLEICPRKQFTTLDTHDGIGVVDVKDLLTDQEIEETREALYTQGANVKKIYSTEAYNNLDIYQINCTYYSALGNSDAAYLLARAIQCFAPGIPQIYYVGLLAGENDITLLEATKEGRNINRHYYEREEIRQETQRPVVKKLFDILRFRNKSEAFNGEIKVVAINESLFEIKWINDQIKATLTANLKEKQFTITENQENQTTFYFDSQEDY